MGRYRVTHKVTEREPDVELIWPFRCNLTWEQLKTSAILFGGGFVAGLLTMAMVL